MHWTSYVSITISSVGLAVSIVAIIIFSRPQLTKQKYEQRLAKFNSIGKTLSANPLGIHEMLKRNFEKQKPNGWVFNYLLFKPEWITDKWESVKIGQIGLTAVGNYSAPSFMPKIFNKSALPIKNISLSSNLLQFSNQNLYNNVSYCLNDISIQDDSVPMLHIKHGKYFDYIDTCFRYKLEAALESLVFQKKRKFKLRKKFPVTNITNRFTAIGISTLVILKNYDHDGIKGTYFLLHERSGSVSDEIGMIAAIPGGNFQPSAKNADKIREEGFCNHNLYHNSATALEINIVREILEELFAKDEYSVLVSDDMVTSHSLFNTLKNNIYFLGCGLNPVTAFLEILTYCVVDMDNPKLSDFSEVKLNSESINFMIKPLDENTVKHYEILSKSCASLKLTCNLIGRDFKKFEQMLTQ